MGCTVATVRALALAFPETTEEPHHDMTSFRVGGKIFATVTADEARVHIFVGPDEVAAYCAEYPGLVEELWWGKRLSGCRMVLKSANRAVVRELLTEAFRRRASSKLLAQLDG